MGRSEASQQLHILFFPLMAHGHSLPMFDIAHLCASRNVRTTLLLTPYTANTFPNPTATNIHIRHIHIPTTVTAPAGLPEGLEHCDSLTTLPDNMRFLSHLHHFEPDFRALVSELLPDTIVSDTFLPWTANVACDLGIPRLAFTGRNYFEICVTASIHRFAPEKLVASDYQPFLVPGLPDPIELTKSKLPDLSLSEEYRKLFEHVHESVEKSYGIIMNSFYDLESAYIEHTTTVLNQKTWPVGPVSLGLNKGKEGDVGKKSNIQVEKCLSWLDSKQPKSVLYICFGSHCSFTPAQHKETAAAIEMLGCNFLWVLKTGEILPDGFKESVGDKGMIITGWAPQLVIINHEAISAFVTHCGWNSTLEAICAGVPMVTWPVFAEQFYTEKLLSRVLGIGVEVGVRRWVANLEDEGREVVGRAAVATAVAVVTEEGVGMRRKVKELGELAKKAMDVAGSSYVSLGKLIEELMDIKRKKAFKS